jgi:hypothetical protein
MGRESCACRVGWVLTHRVALERVHAEGKTLTVRQPALALLFGQHFHQPSAAAARRRVSSQAADALMMGQDPAYETSLSKEKEFLSFVAPHV